MNTQIQNEFKKPMRRQNWATKLKNDAIKTEIACDIVVDGVAKVVKFRCMNGSPSANVTTATQNPIEPPTRPTFATQSVVATPATVASTEKNSAKSSVKNSSKCWMSRLSVQCRESLKPSIGSKKPTNSQAR